MVEPLRGEVAGLGVKDGSIRAFAQSMGQSIREETATQSPALGSRMYCQADDLRLAAARVGHGITHKRAISLHYRETGRRHQVEGHAGPVQPPDRIKSGFIQRDERGQVTSLGQTETNGRVIWRWHVQPCALPTQADYAVFHPKPRPLQQG